jgi:hypothetical protein
MSSWSTASGSLPTISNGLLVLPVLEHDNHQMGVPTIDDILEAAIAPRGAGRPITGNTPR